MESKRTTPVRLDGRGFLGNLLRQRINITLTEVIVADDD